MIHLKIKGEQKKMSEMVVCLTPFQVSVGCVFGIIGVLFVAYIIHNLIEGRKRK